MKWFQIELSEEEHKGLRVYAAVTGRTMTEAVRGLIAGCSKAGSVIEDKVKVVLDKPVKVPKVSDTRLLKCGGCRQWFAADIMVMSDGKQYCVDCAKDLGIKV